MASYSPTIKVAQPIRLVICGGGASAVLLLAALKERTARPIEVTVMEPRHQPGAGIAYSTGCLVHLLNTRACNMSVNGDTTDFLRWLQREHPRRGFNWGAEDFAPRQYYGEYLQSKLLGIRTAPNIQLSWLRTAAHGVVAHGHEWEVIPAQGASTLADIVVFATGNEAPAPLGTDLGPQAQSLILNNPWEAARKNEIPPDAAVLIAGTGLTAVDVVAELLHRRHAGPIFAFSRRALLPRCHGAAVAFPEGLHRAFPSSLRAIVQRVRELAGEDASGSRWRGVMTELRSMAPALWAAWDPSEQRRFLRHVRPFWDVHRHRLAPVVHARLARAIARGQLTIVRGRLESLEHVAARASLRATLRQNDSRQLLEGAVLINCTGPQAHPLRAANPLLQRAVADGVARPDPLALGLATDQRFRVISRDGAAQRALYALGTLARGSQWELTAVPEIRDQAQSVARDIELFMAARAHPASDARVLVQAQTSLAM
jgi:uncharacterized NAD(P)/FAD-binding protein YdhS